jgi:hypothetical protein
VHGRHTDPDRGAFWRSLATAAAKALLVLAVLAGLTTIIVALTGDADGEDSASVLTAGEPTPTERAGAAATASPDAPAPAAGHADRTPAEAEHDGADEQPAPDAGPDDSGADAPDAADDAPDAADDAPDAAAEVPADDDPTPAPPADVSVQVIDSGGGAQAIGEVVALLGEWGYDVVAVNLGLCCYETTTVFYSDGWEPDAAALQARDGRFAVLEENDRLAETVALHVVVGEDWDAP